MLGQTRVGLRSHISNAGEPTNSSLDIEDPAGKGIQTGRALTQVSIDTDVAHQTFAMHEGQFVETQTSIQTRQSSGDSRNEWQKVVTNRPIPLVLEGQRDFFKMAKGTK